MASDNYEAFQDLIPEGEIPYMSIRIVATMNGDGEPLWHAGVTGDSRIGALIGQVELFKHWLLTGNDSA